MTETNDRYFAKKRFGQNFLIDQNIIHKIISALNLNKEDIVLEIGPGLGALTEHLLNNCKNLHLVEVDRDLAATLEKKFVNQDIKIFNQDILKFDLNFIKTNNMRIIGNLPYNISTPIIFKLLKNINLIKDMHFMLQNEVVDRLIAVPGSKTYGRLSVMVQYFCKVTKILAVPNSAFSPKPKVESAVVRLIPHKELPVIAKDFDSLQLVVKAAFSKRRKTIANALKGLITVNLLDEMNIDKSKRPEELSIKEFVMISNKFKELS